LSTVEHISSHTARDPNTSRRLAPRARVLWANDNAVIREYVSQVLSEQFDVTNVADGQAALDAARTAPPDVILGDVSMPRLDGVALLRAVRADPRLKTVPVILLSVKAAGNATNDTVAEGADDYIVGPFGAQELQLRVRAQVERAQALEERERAHARVATILENTTECYYSVDGDFRFTFVNPRTEQFFEMSREDLIGRDCTDVLAKTFGEECVTRQRKALAEQRPDHSEFLSPTIERWIELHVFPAAWGMNVQFRDVTEQHRSQETLLERQRQLADELAKAETLHRIDLMERARTEMTLRESQATVQSFYDTAPFMMGIAEIEDEKITLVSANRLSAAVFGPRDEATLERSDLATSAAVEALWLQHLRKSELDVAPVHFEYQEPRVAGAPWLYATVALVGRGASGRQQFSFIAENVTERRQREANLAFLNEISADLLRLTSPTEMMSELGAKVGEYFRVTRCSFAEVNDTVGEVTVKHEWLRDAHGASAGRRTERLRDLISEEFEQTARAGEMVIVRDTRTDLRTDAAAYPGRDTDTRSFLTMPFIIAGKWCATLSIADAVPRDWRGDEIDLMRDLSTLIWTRLDQIKSDSIEREQTEDALRESAARFRSIADLVPDLLWESALDGSVTWYNQRWCEYTGQTSEGAIGSNWLDVIHHDDRDAAARHYSTAAATGQAFTQECRVRAADGTFRWFLILAEPQRDSNGQTPRWFGAATDIHAQRSALEEAERRVVERTEERDSLCRQLVETEEAERRRLARDLHDQFGQQITAFALGTEDAIRLAETHIGPLAPPSAPLVQRLEGLQILSREMQQCARYLALELRPPELDDVGLESALETYVREFSTRYGISTDLTITGLQEIPISMEVGSTVYRIVQEALTNVARHARCTRVSVLIDRRPEEVRLIVEDNGLGFDMQAIALRTKAEHRLGLAGMRERAALVGGDVAIESIPGTGTSLYVRLPSAPRAQSATVSPALESV
jgi:PAS domain S-box-containing protein